MKSTSSILLAAAVVLLAMVSAACDKGKDKPQPGVKALAQMDIPILPVKPGDTWTYQTRLEIPEGVTSAGAAAVSTSHRRTRTYLGKVSAANGLPETDCFEVVIPGSPKEREFVEIHDDRVLMRGSMIMRPETTQPMWLATPVPFVIAGMRAGTAIPEFQAAEGGLTRKTQVIAREDITVPAGTYHCIQLLTTGNDGEIELRRNVWFAPGKGIVREEKTRYRRGQLLFRETQELLEFKSPGSI